MGTQVTRYAKYAPYEASRSFTAYILLCAMSLILINSTAIANTLRSLPKSRRFTKEIRNNILHCFFWTAIIARNTKRFEYDSAIAAARSVTGHSSRYIDERNCNSRSIEIIEAANY